MPNLPKILSSKFFPGMGEQHEVGLVNVGVHVVETTMCVNPASIATDAGIISSIPNTGAANMSYGPVVHSLGIAPSVVIPMGNRGATVSSHEINFVFVTADNSAVYLRPRVLSGGATVGVSVRIQMVR